MSIPVALLVLSLAGARLTRLLVDDQITLPLRRRVVAWSGADGMVSYLANCPWCMGLWVSIALCLAARAAGLLDSWAVAALMAPAVSYGAMLIRAMIEE